MRRTPPALLAALLLGAMVPGVGHAQPAGPPHAWLFGAWTGGLFPVSRQVSAQQCLAQPTVIFTRDVVLRASLTEVTYSERVVLTARSNAGGTDFVFTPGVDPAAALGSGLMGMEPPKPAAGFGCESTDTLHVRRLGDNEIEFPGCADFPNPLVRCPAR